MFSGRLGILIINVGFCLLHYRPDLGGSVVSDGIVMLYSVLSRINKFLRVLIQSFFQMFLESSGNYHAVFLGLYHKPTDVADHLAVLYNISRII